MRTFIKKYDQNVKPPKDCGRSPDKKLKKINAREAFNGWAYH